MYSTIREARSSEVYRLHALRPMDADALLGPMHLWSIDACVLADLYAFIKPTHYQTLHIIGSLCTTISYALSSTPLYLSR